MSTLYEDFEHFGDGSNNICLPSFNRGEPLRGIWPLIDENFNQTEFVSIGHKNGLPHNYWLDLKRIFGSKYKFIFSPQSGPFFSDHYDWIYKKFDGVMDTDPISYNSNRLNMNHSMMVRSMPDRGYAWPPSSSTRYDFGLLTMSVTDNKCKRWDRAEPLVSFLCDQGLKGVLINQQGTIEDLQTRMLKRHIESDQLFVNRAIYSQREFHELMSTCRCLLFPNTLDAFPKFLIEMILANRHVIISDDLLLGPAPLSALGPDCVTIVDYNNPHVNESILHTVRTGDEFCDSRKRWLSLYDFDTLSHNWAQSVNKVFNTNYKRLFFLNHIKRING